MVEGSHKSRRLSSLSWKKILERIAGLEPASSAWKAVALPLSYIRLDWSVHRDSNPVRRVGNAKQ